MRVTPESRHWEVLLWVQVSKSFGTFFGLEVCASCLVNVQLTVQIRVLVPPTPRRSQCQVVVKVRPVYSVWLLLNLRRLYSRDVY